MEPRAWPQRARPSRRFFAITTLRRNSKASHQNNYATMAGTIRSMWISTPFVYQRFKKWSAPCPDRKQTAKQQNRIDTLASFRRSIDVTQVQPQRELVQRKCSADPIHDRDQPAHED